MDAAKVKTCEYCGVEGIMPTFMDGETSCYSCITSFPQTTRELKHELYKQRVSTQQLKADVIGALEVIITPFDRDNAIRVVESVFKKGGL